MHYGSILFLLFFAINANGKNACLENDPDKTLVKSNTDFVERWTTCSRISVGIPAKTAECLQNIYPKIGHECINCFGSYAGCTLKNCFSICAMSFLRRGGEKKCAECSMQYCGPDLKTCTGISLDQLPSKYNL